MKTTTVSQFTSSDSVDESVGADNQHNLRAHDTEILNNKKFNNWVLPVANSNNT